MGRTLVKTNIKRQPGMLYYCGTASDGYITLCEAEMARGGKKKKKSDK